MAQLQKLQTGLTTRAFSRVLSTVCLWLAATHSVLAQADMQSIGPFEIDRTEVSIGEFEKFVAATKTTTAAERSGGGGTFENGWQQRPGWTWRAPFGQPGRPNEPAVHITYDEAQAYCQWAGKQLPSDAQWRQAAYTEHRSNPPAGFVTGRTYQFPTGDSPLGANCLGDCGAANPVANAITSRGRGHAEVATTKPGVNGLFDMGGNVWEWVDSGPGNEKRTRGGSWWYGAAQMLDSHQQSKPAHTAVIYIGFRCARKR